MEPIVMINDKRGFTLIELMVSFLILTVGLLGMLQGINLAMSQNLESLLRNESIAVADEKMVEKKFRPFVSISTTVANPSWTSTSRYVRGIFKNYSVQQIVTQTTSNSKELVVNVSWIYKNKQGRHSISSVVSESP